MRNSKVKEMTILSLFVALIFAMAFVPYTGYIIIPGSPISFTTLHIVVMIAGFAYGLKFGLVTSFTFGLTSLIKATTAPSLVDQLFVNPLLSILPRLIFGLFVGLIGEFFLNHYKDNKKKFIIYTGIFSILGTIIHTTFFFICFYLFEVKNVGEAFGAIFTTLFTISSAFEIGAAFVVTPLVVNRIMHLLTKKKGR